MTGGGAQVGQVKLPSGEVVPLRRVLRNTGSRRYFLEQHHNASGYAECLCSEKPVEMRIGYRPAHGIYYLYTARHGAQHHEDCHYYRPIGAMGLQNGTAPLIERDGLYIVDLPGATAALQSKSPAPATHQPATGEATGSEPRAGRRHADVQLLLELLLVKSGLTEWRPGFRGKRHYGSVRWRLTSAAEEIEFKDGANFADRLYSPPPFRKARAEEIRTDWSTFTTHVQSAGPSARFFCLGVLKSLSEAKYGSFRVQLSHFPEPIWVPGHLCKTWRAEGQHSLVLLQLYFARKSNALRAAGAGHVVLRDTHWLPANTPEECALIEYLDASGREFVWTFPWQSTAADPKGDVILTDTPTPTHVLLLSASATPQQIGEFALRRGRLEEKGVSSIFFDARYNPGLPDIPIPDK